MAVPPLKIKITADADGVEKGVKKASSSLERINKIAKRVAVALGVVSGAMAVLTKRAFATIDAQAKLAKSLGTTTASVQILERAGELAGVSMSSIEQATKDLQRRLSQAATGTGPAINALDRLGLSAEELLSLNLDQRVDLINRRIKEFIPAAQQAAIAAQLFGEEGSIAISRIDSEALARANEELRELGVLVSEVDEEHIQNANDAISALGLIAEGAANRLASKLAPTLTMVSEIMKDTAKEGGGLYSIMELIGDAIDAMVKGFAAIGVTLGALIEIPSKGAGKAWEDYLDNLARLFGDVAMAGRFGVKQIEVTVKGLNRELSETSEAAEKVVEAFDPLRAKVEVALARAAEQAANMTNVTREMDRAFERSMESAILNYKSAGDAAKRFAATAVTELWRVLVLQKAIAAFSSSDGLFGGLVKGAFGIMSSAGSSFFNSGAAASGGIQVSPLGPPAPNPANFAGGGYTGNGPRSGGLDGMGGRLAMIHPQETVVDHTRGQGVGGTVVNQTFNLAPGVTPDAIAAIRADILPQARQVALASVADQRRRGGAKGRAL